MGRSRIRVYFDYSISWGLGWSCASVCEREYCTEFLLCGSKAKSEKKMLLFSSQLTVAGHGEASLISTPRDPIERRMALGLFGFLSEAVPGILTVALLLCKIEDINEYYWDGKSLWKFIDISKFHLCLYQISYCEFLKITFFKGNICLKIVNCDFRFYCN